MDSIREEVLTVLAARFGVDRAAVTDGSSLKDDLDLDSIDLFDIAGHLEKRTGTDIDLSDFAQVQTFGDLIAKLEEIMAKAPQHVAS